MQLHFTRLPSGVVHRGRVVNSCSVCSAVALVLSWPCGYIAPARPVSLPLISKGPCRSVGGLILSFFYPSYVALVTVARRRSSWHDSSIPLSLEQVRVHHARPGGFAALATEGAINGTWDEGAVSARGRSAQAIRWCDDAGGSGNMWDGRESHALFVSNLDLPMCLPACLF